MAGVGERAKFAFEPIERRRVEARQGLERDARPALTIDDLVDDAGRPGTQTPEDVKTAVAREIPHAPLA